MTLKFGLCPNVIIRGLINDPHLHCLLVVAIFIRIALVNILIFVTTLQTATCTQIETTMLSKYGRHYPCLVHEDDHLETVTFQCFYQNKEKLEFIVISIQQISFKLKFIFLLR